MKKTLVGTFSALALLLLLSVTAFAAPGSRGPAAGPFEGIFTGTVTGDSGSRAEITLDLTDRDNVVTGTAELGSGLVVDAGRVCGRAALPASTLTATGEKSPRRSNELTIEAPIDVGPFEVTIEVEGELSADGELLAAEAKIDVPWICGRDPVISGTLARSG